MGLEFISTFCIPEEVFVKHVFFPGNFQENWGIKVFLTPAQENLTQPKVC